MEKTANRLKQLREKAGLNQTQLAKKIGISEQSISKYERGERKPKIEKLEALASFFGVSTAYLLGLDKDSNNLQLKNGGRKLRTKFFTSVIDVDKSIDQKINEWIETSNPSMRIIDIKFQTNYSAPLLKASALIIYEDDGSSEGYASDEEYKERLENFLRELESKEDAD